MNLDRERIRGDLARLVTESITIKHALRTTWREPMADAQRRHAVLRRRITDLCALLAATRGRLHVTRPPRGHAGAFDPVALRDAVLLRAGRDYAADAGVASEVRA